MSYQFTSDANDLDLDVIHGFLVSSYWAKGISRALVEQSIQHSLCFGIKDDAGLVAFGRFVTDTATFAYLADVFVLPEHRGKGLAKKMMREALALPQLSGLRRMMLTTKDAQPLYEKFGFSGVSDPTALMERLEHDIYQRGS